MVYNEALDHQMELTAYWTSEAGLAMFHGIQVALSKKRREKGHSELDAEGVIEDETQVGFSLAGVRNGECYYWAPDILDMVNRASSSLPNTWSLLRHHIPSASGFFWLGKELDNNVVALSWTVMTVDRSSRLAALPVGKPGKPMPDFNAICLVSFVNCSAGGFSYPWPCRTEMVVGETLEECKLEIVRFATANNIEMEEFSGDMSAIRLFATMLTFIQQKIMVRVRTRVSRATWRRAMRANREAEPEVNVVMLRKAAHHSQQGDAAPVDWQCRWIVHGHWRNQWYPSLEVNQPIFIPAYVKGPDDKPLKDPQRIFAVVR